MGTYCGCATTASKIKWALGVIGMVLGVIFLIAALVVSFNNYDDYKDCLDELVAEGRITRRQRDDAVEENVWDDNDNPYIEDCKDDHLEDGGALALFILMIIFFVAGSIPFYAMCCCSQNPNKSNNVFVTQPYQQNPTYGQPVYSAQVQMTNV